MSWRELRTFIKHLPRESAYARAELGEDADWDVKAHLLARIANDTTTANYQRASKRVPDKALIHPPSQAKKPRAEANGQSSQGWKELDALF